LAHDGARDRPGTLVHRRQSRERAAAQRSGRGSGREAGLAFDSSETAPGDAERLAERAVAGGFRRVLAIGGDGTLNEMINGMLASGVPTADCLVAAAAGGTGNDWSCTMAVPDDAHRLVACMVRAARPQISASPKMPSAAVHVP
jgi:diacylglycerol kinase family enzyme